MGVFPRALVLVPTRELAAQVAASFEELGRHTQQRCVLVFGGVCFFIAGLLALRVPLHTSRAQPA